MNKGGYEYQGKVYGTLNELAAASGVTEPALRYRMRKYGLTAEQAITTKLKRRPGRLHYYHGEKHTISEIAEMSGMAAQRIYERMHKGWSIEDAADIPMGHDSRLRRATVAQTTRGESGCARWDAARKIASYIATGDLASFGFECVVPKLEYTFNTDLLRYTIRFDNESDPACARLSAAFIKDNLATSLDRRYRVEKGIVKECFGNG